MSEESKYAQDMNRFVEENQTPASVSGESLKTQEIEGLYPRWNCPVCGDWFHMPYKFCKCKENFTYKLGADDLMADDWEILGGEEGSAPAQKETK